MTTMLPQYDLPMTTCSSELCQLTIQAALMILLLNFQSSNLDQPYSQKANYTALFFLHVYYR